MYLVDSSIWIDAINNALSPAALFLKSLPLGSCALMPLIYTEVLQGAKNQKTFNTYQFYLSPQKFYYLKNPQESYAQAALIYFKCRKKGITVRSTVDCLIAQCAIENDVILLHNDQDFVKMASVLSTLKQQYADG